MRLTESYDGSTVVRMVPYMLHQTDRGEDLFTVSQMPSTVALEIAQRAKTLVLRERDGSDWLVANNRDWFPAEAFDLEGREVPRDEGKPEAPKRRTRRRTAKSGS